MRSLNQTIITRQKRGLLGKFLTSVFGVNDEVYQDIDALEINQKELAKISDHQTKFMLSAISTFNSTEQRIEERLNKLTTSFNNGIRALNDMQNWYQKIDHNRLNIQLLQMFQLTHNYIEEVQGKWKHVLHLQLQRGHIYELMSPAHIQDTLERISQKLPSNLEILQTPVINTLVNITTRNIWIDTYFIIQDVTSFALSKITPLPYKITKNRIWMPEIQHNILAISYDTQMYFPIDSEELQKSIKLPAHTYICSPPMVESIQRNPNCVIDELFNRNPKKECGVNIYSINQTIWQPLQMINTWICIVSTPTTIAVICSGVREESVINVTSIIKISSDCSIHTQERIIQSQIISSGQVISSFVKQVSFNQSMIDVSSSNSPPKLTLETTPKSLEPNLQELYDNENKLQEMIHTTVWKSIKHHSVISVTTTAITIIFLLGGFITWIFVKCHNRKETQQLETITLQEAVPLQPSRESNEPRFPPIRRPRQNVQFLNN